MPSERDLFAHFERMRREMDELFGDVFERATLAPQRRAAFSPRVDVVYADDPPRAIVVAELAGIDPEALDLEVRGRELVLAGARKPVDAGGERRVHQQVEIEHGPFRRTIQLGAEVDADATRASYEDGILRVELPLVTRTPARRTVPVEVPGE